jgi:hypothetical protein
LYSDKHEIDEKKLTAGCYSKALKFSNFMLDTIDYYMSGNISEACSETLYIEFVITGFSPKNESN